MKQEELNEIVEQHQHWLKEDCKGWEDMRANLSGANLSGADLRMANLRMTDLNKADLCMANLRMTDLSGADLREANLRGANLTGANLSGADLRWANLREANLTGADLSETDLSEDENFRLGRVLDEPLTGYKTTREGVVITAEIPAGAVVFCINGRKCRANRAKITDMAGHEILHSSYDNSFEYRLGQEIEIKGFNLMYNIECANGFHFFRTRKEAEEHNG
jgi:hypothetical protein